ncbi:MAG: patatin-like phospholipase family protein [Odoribacter sp.]
MMRIYKVILFLLLLCISLQAMPQRKKVGLVLGGGGAKGAAHIGVLKVLEEAGIPVDYIAGTSIGSIVGGLYAIGYDLKTLDSLFRTQDWTYLLSDKVYRHHRSFPSKEAKEKYLLSLPYFNNQKGGIPAGLVSGQNIYNLFSDMTIGYHDVASFDSLPIPFACVAIDLVSGKDVVLNKGSLPLAMRSSMSIPGVFEPIEMNGMVLIDGGVINNLPTNVVKEMGAEIIIGVDLTIGWRSPEEVKTMPGLIDQLTNIMGEKIYQQNKHDVDLYLNPDLKGYSPASFSRIEIDSMILRGETIARKNWNELMKLKQTIYAQAEEIPQELSRPVYPLVDSLPIGHLSFDGVSAETEKWIRKRIKLKENTIISVKDIDQAITVLYGMGIFNKVDYQMTTHSPYDLSFSLKEKPLNNLNIGFRFDTEEMASILLNTTINQKFLHGSSFSITGRLSQNPYLHLSANFGNNFARKIGLSYLLKYNDFRLYSGNQKIDHPSFLSQSGELSYSDVYYNLKCRIGIHYDYFSYRDELYDALSQAVKVSPEGYFNYFTSISFDNFNDNYYPTQGISARIQGELYTDNLLTYNGNAPFAALSFGLGSAISLSKRFTMIPSLQGRFLLGKDIAPIYQNYLGGEINGRYLPQQLAFSGIRYVQVFKNELLLAKLALRYRIGKNHYVTALGEYARESDQAPFLNKGNDLWGRAVRYSYNSIIGPIGAEVNYSNRDNSVGVYFNLGYNF